MIVGIASRASDSGRGRDVGSGEVVVTMFVAVAAVAFVLLITLAGRASEASSRVHHAAEASAQSAALARDPVTAVHDATTTATSSLGGLGGLCASGPAVSVDTSGWRAAGVVVVSIRCRVRTADLSPLPLPGGLMLSSSSAAVIDAFRYTEGAS